MKVDMSGGSPPIYWRGFGLPPVESLTLDPYNSFNIPRSYHHSSDESEGSPSGGYGGSHPPNTGLVPATFGPNPQQRPQQVQVGFLGPPHSFDDAPFVPHRSAPPAEQYSSGAPPGADPGNYRRNVNTPLESHQFAQTPRRGYERDRVSPTESDRSFESDRSASLSGYSEHSGSSVSSGYDYRSSQRQPPYPRPSFSQERYPAYDRDSRRVGIGNVQLDAFGRPVAAQSYYRPQTHSYPTGVEGQDLTGGHDVSGRYQTHSQSGSSTSSHSSTISLPPAVDSGSPSDPSDAGPYLRQQLGIGPNAEVSLYALADPDPGQRPNYPLPTLIKLAIYGSPRKQLTLQEIYAALEDRFLWYRQRTNEKAWKNSIRHNLSLNKVFRNVARPITEPGKGSYWKLDVSEGEGYKRTRKRRAKGSKTNQAAEDDDEMSDSDSSSLDLSSSTATERGASFSQEEFNIDPELRQPGHVVGEGRTRSSIRKMGTSSPYPALGNTPSPVLGGQTHLPQGQFSMVDPTSGTPLRHDPNPSMLRSTAAGGSGQGVSGFPGAPEAQASQPSFGRPVFGQPSFVHPAPAARPNSTSLPRTFISSSSEAVSFQPHLAANVPAGSPRPAVLHDRNAPIVQPSPRPGIEYVRDESGLPSARRVVVLGSSTQSQVNAGSPLPSRPDSGFMVSSQGSTSSSSSGDSEMSTHYGSGRSMMRDARGSRRA